MKKIISILLSLSLMLSGVIVSYAEGEGTSSDNPIKITDIDSLKAFAKEINASTDGGEGKYYLLTSNINLNDDAWSTPIGTSSVPFRGHFDGNGHTISNFTMTSYGGATGIFGYVGGDATISNVGIKNASTILAEQWSWSAMSGGLIGCAIDNATISGCYSKSVSAHLNFEKTSANGQFSAAGGLIGSLDGAGVKVFDCYALSTDIASGETNFDGGLIGGVMSCSSVENCYTDTYLVRCYNSTGGKVKNCYYIQLAPWPWTSDPKDMYAGTKITPEEMKTKASALGSGFSADSVLGPINDGYPILSWEADLPVMEGFGTQQKPYLIKNAENLAQISGYVDTTGKYFELECDIDLEGNAWTSYIGTNAYPFRGNFNGNGYKIKNFVLNAPKSGMTGSIGLFAYVGGDAVIKNVGIENVTVSPVGDWGFNTTAGSLAGTVKDGAKVDRCSAKNVVVKNIDNAQFALHIAGGLVGKASGDGVSITNCYSVGFDVEDNCAATESGLVGVLENFDKVENCYSDTTLTMCSYRSMQKVANSYCIDWTDGDAMVRVGTLVTEDELKSKASDLGEAFEEDLTSANGGFPVLSGSAGAEEDDSEAVIISNKDEFLSFVEAVNNGTASSKYILTSDIDFENAYFNTPAGTEENPFYGNFDGNGHIIKNMKMNCLNMEVYGVFGYVDGNAKIYDLGVENVSANILNDWNGVYSYGSIAAVLLGRASVSRCYAKNVTLTRTPVEPGYCAFKSGGGLVGKINSAGVSVIDCYTVNCDLNDSVTNFDGGLFGELTEAAKIENCYSSTTIGRCTLGKGTNIKNVFCTDTSHWADITTDYYAGTLVTADELKAKAGDLGASFRADSGINDGFPVLAWQVGESSGDEVSGDEYLIENAEDLAAIASMSETAGKVFNLAGDIDLGGVTWTGIGTEENPFCGKFNGNGHIIKNYNFTMPGDGSYGLFAYVGGNAVIYDLGIENTSATLTEQWSWGAIFGGIAGTVSGNASIDRCYSKGFSVATTFEKTSANGHIHAAGAIIGMTDGDAKVTNSYAINTNIIDSLVDYDGGLIGKILSCNRVENCYSYEALARCYDAYTDKVANSYYIDTAPWPWAAVGDAGSRYVGTQVTVEEIKTKAEALGSNFVADTDVVNGGYPMLVWEKIESVQQGTGTNIDPYLIRSVNDLMFVSGLQSTEGKYFKLMNDIDLGGAVWTTKIGTEAVPFQGEFDGNGNVIKNFRLNIAGDDSYGLFGYIGENAYIHNLGVEGMIAELQALYSWASACGGLAGVAIGNATVENCYAKNVDFTIAYEKTSANGEIRYGGGLIGWVNGEGVEIKSCYAQDVNEVKENKSFVNNDGGLVGMIDDAAVIANCYSDSILGRHKIGINVQNSCQVNWPKEWPAGYAYEYSYPDLTTLGYDWCDDFAVVENSAPVLKWELYNGKYTNLVFGGNMNTYSGEVGEVALDDEKNSLVLSIAEGEAYTNDVSLSKDAYYRITFSVKADSQAKLVVKFGENDMSDEISSVEADNGWDRKSFYVKADADGMTTLEISSDKSISLDDVEVIAVDKELEKTAIKDSISFVYNCVDVIEAPLYINNKVYDGLDITYTSENGYIDGEGSITASVPMGVGYRPETFTANVKLCDETVTKSLDVNVKMSEPYDITLNLLDADGNQVYGISCADMLVIDVEKNSDAEASIIVASYNDGRLLSAEIKELPAEDALELPILQKNADIIKVYVLEKGTVKPLSVYEKSYEKIDKTVTIHTIGDSICATYPETSLLKGWGEKFGAKFNSDKVVVDNTLAVSGMTAGRFISSGRFDQLMNKLDENDYVLIQLGTNDCDNFSRYEFEFFLGQFVTGIRGKNAYPVFVTAPERLSAATDTKSDGVNYDINSYLKDYDDIMRAVAEEKNVPVLDLNAYTVKLLSENGYSGVNDMGYYVADELHYTDAGAEWICESILAEAIKYKLPFAEYVVQ